jgi:predicted nucleotidyltransferase
MNIHCNNENILEYLKSRTIVRIPIGSYMYGTNNEKSDRDFLNIFLPPKNYYLNPFRNHHQIQFKIDGTDEIFTDIIQFVQNLVNGDSTINFECLFTQQFKNSPLKFIRAQSFYTYTIARAYLGFAKRDLKRIADNPTKKAIHILRGLEIAEKIISSDNISLDFSKHKYFSFVGETESFVNEYLVEEKNLRYMLNCALEKNYIDRFLDPTTQKEIYNKIMNLYNDYEFQEIELNGLYDVFEANENINIKYS